MAEYDIIVIGAGPAGAMAARQLATDGAAVLLVDKQRFPRQKVCGCCINAQALGQLAAAGLGEKVAAHHPVRLRTLRVMARGVWTRFNLPPTVTLDRATLDQMLVQAAIEAGARFRDGLRAVVQPQDRPGGWEVALASDRDKVERIRAAVVIAADGLDGGALSKLRGFAARVVGRSYVGLRAFVEADKDIAREELWMHCATGGYVGCAALGDGRINVAAAVAPKLVRDRGPAGACASIIRGAGAIRWARRVGGARFRGTGLLSQRRDRVAGPGLFVIGDAAGYIEPFTGQGIAWALTAGTAVAPIAIDALDDHEARHARRWQMRYRKLFAREHRRCAWITAGLRRPALAAMAIGVAQRHPGVARHAARGLLG